MSTQHRSQRWCVDCNLSILTGRSGKQLNIRPGNKYGSVPCKGMCRGGVINS